MTWDADQQTGNDIPQSIPEAAYSKKLIRNKC